MTLRAEELADHEAGFGQRTDRRLIQQSDGQLHILCRKVDCEMSTDRIITIHAYCSTRKNIAELVVLTTCGLAWFAAVVHGPVIAGAL
jgi:hypothetical protein